MQRTLFKWSVAILVLSATACSRSPESEVKPAEAESVKSPVKSKAGKPAKPTGAEPAKSESAKPAKPESAEPEPVKSETTKSEKPSGVAPVKPTAALTPAPAEAGTGACTARLRAAEKLPDAKRLPALAKALGCVLREHCPTGSSALKVNAKAGEELDKDDVTAIACACGQALGAAGAMPPAERFNSLIKACVAPLMRRCGDGWSSKSRSSIRATCAKAYCSDIPADFRESNAVCTGHEANAEAWGAFLAQVGRLEGKDPRLPRLTRGIGGLIWQLTMPVAAVPVEAPRMKPRNP